jgi:acyl carrier protein
VSEFHRSRDRNTVQAWLIKYITQAVDVPVTPFPTGDAFDSYGFDSTETVIMAGVMEEEFGIELEPALFFENPSVDGLVESLAKAGLISG